MRKLWSDPIKLMNEYSYFEKGCRQKSARDNPEK